VSKKLYIFFMSVLAASAFTATLKAEAKGCCCPPLKPSMKPRFYLDVGVEHAFDSQVGSSGSVLGNFIGTPILFTLSGANRALPNSLLIGAGFLWSDLYQAQSPYLPFMSLGLQYQYTNFDNKKTLIQMDVVSPSTGETDGPFKADYIFSQNSLLGNLKIDLYRWGRMMPYLNLGLGASWNQAKNKKPFINDLGFGDTLDFASTKTRITSFSYTVGAGLDFLMTKNFWLSLGYSYNNFGKISIDEFFTSLNGTVVESLSPRFNLGTLATHNIQLTGRYAFG